MKSLFIAVLALVSSSVFAIQSSTGDAQALLQKLLVERPNNTVVGERYEGTNLLSCPSGGKVSAQYFQWLADADGSARRLSWVKSDAPFLWVLKDTTSGRALLAFYSEVGGAYSVDHSHGTKPMNMNSAGLILAGLLGLNQSLMAAQLPTVGWFHTCAIEKNTVTCQGDNSAGQLNVPALVNPRQVSAGGLHTCAIDDNGVKCWGFNEYGQTDSPSLKNPREVSAGGSHTCALDDDGVKCWGKEEDGRTAVPALTQPRQASSGALHTCALDEKGVTCWGNNQVGQLNVPRLHNPRQISAGGGHTCALDDEGVKCWGDNKNGQLNVPLLNHPREVSAGFQNSCALDDSGLKCWGAIPAQDFNRSGP